MLGCKMEIGAERFRRWTRERISAVQVGGRNTSGRGFRDWRVLGSSDWLLVLPTALPSPRPASFLHIPPLLTLSQSIRTSGMWIFSETFKLIAYWPH